MRNFIQFVGPQNSLQLFGIRLLGVNEANAKKVLFSIVFVLLMLLLRQFLTWCVRGSAALHYHRLSFWIRQATSIAVASLSLIGLTSIWFDNPARLTTALGLITAGLAFALQRVVTAFAGYLLILRGNTFHVGDRIVMGGVRGDVVAVGFFQTTIMEMGQPPSVQSADPDMWVKGRQYSGRIVSVTNAKVFDEAIYNYTRDFPYIWDEINIPIPYSANRARAKYILLEVARKHTIQITEMSKASLAVLEDRFLLKRPDLEPSVFVRLTDNWIELSLRFLMKDHGIREAKSEMSNDILDAFDREGITVASSTYHIVGLPPVQVEMLNHMAQPRS